MNRIGLFALILGFVFVCAEVSLAQGTGGNQNGGGGTGQIPTQQPTQNQNQNQGGGDVSMPSSPFQLGDLLTIGQDFTRESVYENKRIQPFVGPSQQNVSHPRSQIDPAGSTLGSAGGAGGGGFSFTSNNRNAGQTGRANTGFGGAGGTSTNGGSVPRRGVRSALSHTPVMTASPQTVSSRFAGRLARLPALRSAGQIEMSVENRVATLSGIVESAEQGDLIARQAELEPGVDSVVNNLQVRQ